MEEKQKYRALGLMSGTSLDGVDVACCTFQKKGTQWEFKIDKAMTVHYTSGWINKLSNAHTLSAEDLVQFHTEYGIFLGNLCRKFIQLYGLKQIDFIASHGHTIFHQPQKKFTFQLGDGNAIHAISKLPVVYDFRSLDVALGGQGAPLVPIGDHFLFGEYDICLNIGGIANLSQVSGGKRIAFDVCVANMGLNYLAMKMGNAFDKQGQLASDGELNKAMLKSLRGTHSKIRTNRLSLGREFFEQKVKPVLDNEEISVADRLTTFAEFIAIEIAFVLDQRKKSTSVLCTGGGTFNSYLVYRLLELCGDHVNLIIPDPEIVKFKEALIFAFLGVRRVRNEINSLKSVTQATRDSCGGVLIGV